jgi:hypothetical protein
MGKTVESYRMALEGEISRWNGFARDLRKDDREAFEKGMDMFRNNAMAAIILLALMNAVPPDKGN